MDEPATSDTMRRIPAACPLFRRIRNCERGIGLIELLAVIPMLAATLLATYALYDVASNSQARTDNRPRA